MVAVVSGSGLGLFGSSVAALGGVGATGNSGLGRGTDRVFVNSTNGNLIIRSQDERLSALGLDVSLIRTYNSQGLMDDDNGDNWRLGLHQRWYNLTGTVNTAGSTIRKVFGDGRDVLYTYDVAQSRYISTDGDGAHDTLTNSGGTWTWTDGSGRNTETYNSSGQLTHSRDTDGNTVSYTYTGNLLTSITDASGQTTFLDYTGNNLTSIRVVSDGQTQTLTRYYYDSSNRLRQVVLDLSPADNTVSLVDANSDGLYESVNDQMYV
ncbi:RHS repeat domain-containing protein, partial [Steroidobacter flavus]